MVEEDGCLELFVPAFISPQRIDISVIIFHYLEHSFIPINHLIARGSWTENIRQNFRKLFDC